MLKGTLKKGELDESGVLLNLVVKSRETSERLYEQSVKSKTNFSLFQCCLHLEWAMWSLCPPFTAVEGCFSDILYLVIESAADLLSSTADINIQTNYIYCFSTIHLEILFF